MSRVLIKAQDLVDYVVEAYHESALFRAICQGVTLFAGLVILDWGAGFPTGTRMAYVLPLWLATMRGGRNAGATLVLVTTITLALVDSARQGRTNGVMVNFVLQTAVLYALMLIFDNLESKLRDVTKKATRDSLTGLYNRSTIDERARKAIDRAIVLNQPMAIAMVDCDQFKELNDEYGHAVGDEVLRILAKTMRRTFMSEATVGRAGGDEFIVIMPNRDRREAQVALQTALDRFLAHTEIVGRSTGFSYGVGVVGENGFEYSNLLRVADEDMYRRKAARSSCAVTLAS
jgi:diguanylate cyclase (GGDEF)-like protein